MAVYQVRFMSGCLVADISATAFGVKFCMMVHIYTHRCPQGSPKSEICPPRYGGYCVLLTRLFLHFFVNIRTKLSTTVTTAHIVVKMITICSSSEQLAKLRNYLAHHHRLHHLLFADDMHGHCSGRPMDVHLMIYRTYSTAFPTSVTGVPESDCS